MPPAPTPTGPPPGRPTARPPRAPIRRARATRAAAAWNWPRTAAASSEAEALRGGLRALGRQVAMRPGLAGLHLLRHEAPAIAPTEEQRIRGLGDRVADWVLVACGYDASQVQA